MWQFVGNLRIYKSGVDGEGRPVDDIDVTAELLPDEESRARLFDWLNDRGDIKESDLLTKYFNMKKPKGKGAELPYRWNYVRDRAYPCNETRGNILARLGKAGVDATFLDDKESEEHLWHILYSVSDRTELRTALTRYAKRHNLDDAFVDTMAKFPPFDSDYGAYSAKAVKKLLPLMRMGHHWKADDIDAATRTRIQKILDGEVDESIRTRVRKKPCTWTAWNSSAPCRYGWRAMWCTTATAKQATRTSGAPPPTSMPILPASGNIPSATL